MKIIKFKVLGTPVPQARPRVTRYSTYDPCKESKIKARVLITEALEKIDVDQIINFPIKFMLEFGMPMPKSMSKKKRALMLEGKIEHTKRPDVDNLGKFFTDACTGILYKDDSLITYLAVYKYYAEVPSTKAWVMWDGGHNIKKECLAIPEEARNLGREEVE